MACFTNSSLSCFAAASYPNYLGCILGPVIGGGFADSSATWRWAFYINLILFAVCSPVYFFVLDTFQPQPDVSVGDKVKHIDWLGVVLNAGVYTTFVMVSISLDHLQCNMLTIQGIHIRWRSMGLEFRSYYCLVCRLWCNPHYLRLHARLLYTHNTRTTSIPRRLLT